MREQDRLRNPDWVGLIDPRVPVLRFDDRDGKPIAVVTQYIGDPCIALQLENPSINPDVPGYASEFVAEKLGCPELPVLYFQGCKADIAIKYMFAGEEKARQQGHRLGALMADLAAKSQAVGGDVLASAHGKATVLLTELPSTRVFIGFS